MSKLEKLCDVTLAVEHSWQVDYRLKFYFLSLCGISNAVKTTTLPVYLLLQWHQFVFSFLSAGGNNLWW